MNFKTKLYSGRVLCFILFAGVLFGAGKLMLTTTGAEAGRFEDRDYVICAGDEVLALTDTKETAKKAIELTEKAYKNKFDKVTSFSITPALSIKKVEGGEYADYEKRGVTEAKRAILADKELYDVVVKGVVKKTKKVKYSTRYVYNPNWSDTKTKTLKKGRNGIKKVQYSMTYVNGDCVCYGKKTLYYKRPVRRVVKKGSFSGRRVVKYARRFLGNPYVWGGNSLTRGTDCSGFIKGLFKKYGVRLPRTSGAMRYCGNRIRSLRHARPGDVLCYSGHVALYMGGNRIIHASNPRDGIKISRATYRSILSIRRMK